MIPIYLDPSAVRVAVVGDGVLALRRVAWLRDAGAEPDVWSSAPSAELAAAAGKRLNRRLPSRADLACYHAVWIADVAPADAETLAAVGRRLRVLINVEDAPALCGFHTPAVTRRGKLTLAAGTGGASPAVARAARERLERAFPSGWGEALEEIAKSRVELREKGAGAEALAADARGRLAEYGLV